MNSTQVIHFETNEIVFSGSYSQCVGFLSTKEDHFNYQIVPKNYHDLENIML